MKKRIGRFLLWAGAAGLILAVAGVAFWIHTFRHYPPRAVLKDVRAGLAARHVQEPNARIKAFLEARYGSLNQPANRQQAFLDFFDVDHIKGLDFIVKHTPADQKQANTRAMAQWIADYRDTMTSEERQGIQARLDTPEGRAMLQRATAQFRSQDVYYRGAQTAVITELMTTLAALRTQ